MLRKQDADIIVWVSAVIVFTLAYLWNAPGVKYFPIEGVWSWENIGDSPGMSWYARFVYAIFASMGSGFFARVLCRTLGYTEKVLLEKTVYVLTVLLALILIFAFIYIGYHEYYSQFGLLANS